MNCNSISTSLVSEPFDPVAAAQQFHRDWGQAGAVVTFTGYARSVWKGHQVDHLFLDWYPGMTEASIEHIALATRETFDILAVSAIHRCGKIPAGEVIVFVAAASAHRRAAFEAADFMMDQLKSKAVLWKRECGPDLDRWVEPTSQDAQDLQRWRTPDEC
jgi:molybdopterin synthase catalytic subunit